MLQERVIKGSVVVITGASSGIGRAMAIEFAKAGAVLVLAARRQDALDEVAKECTDLGATAHTYKVDTRDAEAMKTLAKAAKAIVGQVDTWINNAGVLAVGALDEIPAEVNEAVIHTNLIGYINGAHAVVPIFKKQGQGVLINNISVGAWFPTPYMAAYCASKFGLKGFSDALKGELNQYPDIHVCDLFPGFLDTGGIQHAANYTGKNIVPAPPLYDPVKIAQEVVRVAAHPAPTTTAGIFPWLLKLGYLLAPGFSRNAMGAMLRGYLDHAATIEHTSGNVVQPTDYGTGIYGGWKKNLTKRVLPRKQTLLWAGVLAGVLLIGSRIANGK